MNRIYYDSGTTNTRGYLFEDSRLIQTLSVSIGSKDAALSDNRSLLLSALKDIYDRLLDSAHLCDKDIKEIWMSGMISSATGIVEIPHLTAPVRLEELKQGIQVYHEPYFFHRDLHIIPGIKTVPDGSAVTLDNFTQINNMRGEETEIFGILDQHPQLSRNSVLILPGSHTQVAFITEGAITNILSTITGELFDALLHHTILSTSVPLSEHSKIIPEFVIKGFHTLNKLGINRALYTVRTMELFLPSTPAERHSYFEGILSGGIVQLIRSLLAPDDLPSIVVYGTSEAIEVYRALFKELCASLSFTGIEKGRIPYSAYGFLCLSR